MNFSVSPLRITDDVYVKLTDKVRELGIPTSEYLAILAMRDLGFSPQEIREACRKMYSVNPQGRKPGSRATIRAIRTVKRGKERNL